MIEKMFQCVAANVRQRELHDLMRVFHFSKEEMSLIEKTYKNDPPDVMVLAALHKWRERRGRSANGDELVRYLRLIDMPVVASKVNCMKIYSLAHRL